MFAEHESGWALRRPSRSASPPVKQTGASRSLSRRGARALVVRVLGQLADCSTAEDLAVPLSADLLSQGALSLRKEDRPLPEYALPAPSGAMRRHVQKELPSVLPAREVEQQADPRGPSGFHGRLEPAGDSTSLPRSSENAAVPLAASVRTACARTPASCSRRRTHGCPASSTRRTAEQPRRTSPSGCSGRAHPSSHAGLPTRAGSSPPP